MSTAATLTDAQSRNLARLAEIGGTAVHTCTQTVRAPLSQYRREGYRLTNGEKMSHKGLHRTALEWLAHKGVITMTVTEAGSLTDENGAHVVGNTKTTTTTFALKAEAAPEADTRTARDYFRMSGAQLRELATEGAKAEIARRAAKRAAKRAS
jgi:hypothetical protein